MPAVEVSFDSYMVIPHIYIVASFATDSIGLLQVPHQFIGCDSADAFLE
jgi:hypothetical protein